MSSNSTKASNKTASPPTSKPYGRINQKRIQRRQNNDSGEFLLIWERPLGLNETARASARISLNSLDDFVKFAVELNEVPIKSDKGGKDVVVDWAFLDGFDTGGKMHVDANGLQMIDKKLNYRKEFPFRSNNTVPANFYPITSAIAIKSSNMSSDGGKRERQITIMNDRSQGGSAGLRGQRNIEIMQNRRTKKWDKYGVDEGINDLDEFGKGIQVPVSYFMFMNDKNSSNPRAFKSMQRAHQRRID